MSIDKNIDKNAVRMPRSGGRIVSGVSPYMQIIAQADPCPNRDEMVTVHLEHKTNRLRLPNFARCEVFIDQQTGKRTREPVMLASDILSHEHEAGTLPKILLVGSLTAVTIEVEDLAIITEVQLRRTTDRDVGFDRTQIISLEEGTLLDYESGLIKFNASGELVWDNVLSLNDVYVGTEVGKIRYWNENYVIDGDNHSGDFAIDIINGKRYFGRAI